MSRNVVFIFRVYISSSYLFYSFLSPYKQHAAIGSRFWGRKLKQVIFLLLCKWSLIICGYFRPNEKNKTMLNYIQIYRKQLGSSGVDAGDSVDSFFS